MAGAAESAESRTRLEAFDGSDPSLYRAWRRRAKLMLAALPSTIGKEKHGARLMEHIRGEAENLLETVDVDEIIQENGDKKIFQILDDKYLPQPRDLLHAALKGYFYDLSIKPGESYQQFLARYDAALRKMTEQKIELPKVVKGYMLLKKLRLDASQESLVLTATSGKMELEDTIKAVRSVFPEGRGSTKSSKEAFVADDEDEEVRVDRQQGPEDDLEAQIQEVMEAVADEVQSREEDDEVAVEVFETYSEVRRKILEKKKSRGFTPGQLRPDPNRWKLSGTVQGKLELIKSRTRCHKCKQLGHWKRECPMRTRPTPAGDSKGSEVMTAEIMAVQPEQAPDHEKVWNLFKMAEEKPVKTMSWKESLATDVQKTGFADTHSTGNRQRQSAHEMSEEGTVAASESPTSHHFGEVLSIEEPQHFAGDNEVFAGNICLDSGEDELRDQAMDSMSLDAAVGVCAVPDTACRRTLIGQYTLRALEKHLLKQGLRILRKSEGCTFKFGNSGTLTSREAALIPAQIGHRRVLIRAFILPDSGKWTPLLLSKELLRNLGTVIDMDEDVMTFRKLDVSVRLRETKKGHYAIPMFDFDDACCNLTENSNRTKVSREYDISKLEAIEHQAFLTGDRGRDPALPRHAGLLSSTSGDRQDPPDATDLGDVSRYTTAAGFGRLSRHGDRQPQESSSKRDDHAGGQVWQEEGAEEHDMDLQQRQVLCPMGSSSHWTKQCTRDATTSHLHSLPRPSQEVEVAEQHVSGSCASQDVQCPAPEALSGSHSGRDRHGLEVRGSDVFAIMGTSHRPPEGRAELDNHDSRCHECPQSPSGEHEGEDAVCVTRCDRSHVRQHDPCLGVGNTSNETCAEIHQCIDHCPNLSEDEKEECELMGVLKRKDRMKLEQNVVDVNTVGCGMHVLDEKQTVDVMSVSCMQSHDHDFGEVFSLPRIQPVASSRGLKCCDSLDLRNGWDFTKETDRRKCRDMIKTKKPRVLTVCPPCGPFSPLQHLSMGKGNPQKRERRLAEGRVLLAFAMELCELQMELGNIFVFEHPLKADSWLEEVVKRVQSKPGVHEILLDQCMFGLRDPQSKKLYRKPTRLLTNSCCGGHLAKRCNGKHDHQRIEGQTRVGGCWINRSVCAQVYPKSLVLGLVKLVENELQHGVFSVDVHVGEVLNPNPKDVNLEASVMKCHVNLGHPSKERFIHMLKSANASEKAIEIAKSLKCSTCSMKRLHESHPVSKHKRATSFNQQINMDVFDLPIYHQKVLKMLNIYDEGTGMQMCLPLWHGARAPEIRKTYRKNWKRWAGVPRKVLTDGGTEFDAEVQEGFDLDGSYVEKTAAYSPWQNGVCERYGGVWKEAFAKAFEETQPRNKREVNELVDQINVARNTMCRVHGYSPYQHVFGCDLRLPGLITESDAQEHLHLGKGVHHTVDQFLERHEIRLAARKAMVQVDESDKVQRALRYRQRNVKDDLHVGQLVYYWRRYKDDNKKGLWRGPARIIGFYDSSKIWVCHGNKVLRCAPNQLKALTEDQAAAIKFVPVELVAPRGKFAKRGAQTFLDLTKQEPPEHDKPEVDDADQSEPKRPRVMSHHDDGLEIEQDLAQEFSEAAIDEQSTEMGQVTDQQSNDQDNGPEIEPSATGSYGPVRTHQAHMEESDLTKALRRSSDLLDMGDRRLARGPYARPEGEDETPDTLEVNLTALTSDDVCQEHFEAYVVNMDRNSELKDHDISTEEWEQVDAGKEKELKKLLDTGAIRPHFGLEAERIRKEVAPGRILQSRFVKTRRLCPENPEQTEVKCRWVVKGFQDPDIDVLERQSPTWTADGLACVLQLLASFKWRLTVADVEGAFLQGEEYKRDTGPIYVSMPKDKFPQLPADTLFELTKCVYGLMDAPLRWWKSLEKTFKSLGMTQSQLDPCIFYWYDRSGLSGVIACHVDDLLIGGSANFATQVIDPLKKIYPFKHWKFGQSEFLGRALTQREDFSIVIDQREYANKVKVANISKERRKHKDEKLTSAELKDYRAILGAANWLVGSSRPDIAAHTALLQQRVNCATVDDLINANKLISRIKDFSHIQIHVQSIPMSEAVLVVASDSSWGNTDDLGNQAGYFTLLAHKDLEKKVWAKVSPLRWKSYKVDRKTPSTLGAELVAVSRAISEGNWLRSMLGEALHHDYTLDRDRHFRDKLKLMILVDCKPIYDHCLGEQSTIRDKRLAIEMLIVRRDLRNQNSELRWVDTRQMLSDPLTKISADCNFLRFVLKKGLLIVVEESNQLMWRKEERMQ